jgi:hypothetical protein
MRKAHKAVFVMAAFVLMARYFPIYYYATQFNDYVKQAPQQTRRIPQLHQAVLQKAQLYFLPVKPVDVEIKRDGELIRLKVNYKVPVDLFLFKHELSFKASGTGLVARAD